jgi:beta-N-acetylhexosaminidase
MSMNIKDMSLDQKIGQMLMIGFHSKKFDNHIKEMLYEHYIGNVILFSRNIGSKDEIIELTEDIQKNAMEVLGIPALISIDQEGGMVTRISNGATFLPGNMAIAATNDPKNAYIIGEIMGKELGALGINMNLAPVLDVNNNPLNPVIGVRSYGEDPKNVAEFGTNYIRALQEQGVVATAKHFPGHGDTKIDSHVDLPLVLHSMDRLEEIELYPFKAAIDSGVEAIMTAHIIFKALEHQGRPATLSHNIITGLLRNRLGFNGIVITDCMEMSAIAKYFGTANAAVMAVKAGADMILVSHTREKQIDAARAIKQAVLKGDIPIENIDMSVQRILSIKRKYSIGNYSFNGAKGLNDILGNRDHIEKAKEVSLESVTVVKDDKCLLPIKTKNILVISPEPVLMTGVEDCNTEMDSFAQALTDELGGIYSIMDINPDGDYIKNISVKAKDKELIVVGTYNANLNEGQVKLINELYKCNQNIIVVALRNPYDISKFKEIPTYICTYEYTPLSIASLIRVLAGYKMSLGRAPVTIEER